MEIAEVDHTMTIDLHAAQIQNADIPVDHLMGAPWLLIIWASGHGW